MASERPGEKLFLLATLGLALALGAAGGSDRRFLLLRRRRMGESSATWVRDSGYTPSASVPLFARLRLGLRRKGHNAMV